MAKANRGGARFQITGFVQEKNSFDGNDGVVYLLVIGWLGGNKNFMVSRQWYEACPDEGEVVVEGQIVMGKTVKLQIDGISSSAVPSRA